MNLNEEFSDICKIDFAGDIIAWKHIASHEPFIHQGLEIALSDFYKNHAVKFHVLIAVIILLLLVSVYSPFQNNLPIALYFLVFDHALSAK